MHCVDMVCCRHWCLGSQGLCEITDPHDRMEDGAPPGMGFIYLFYIFNIMEKKTNAVASLH